MIFSIITSTNSLYSKPIPEALGMATMLHGTPESTSASDEMAPSVRTSCFRPARKLSIQLSVGPGSHNDEVCTASVDVALCRTPWQNPVKWHQSGGRPTSHWLDPELW